MSEPIKTFEEFWPYYLGEHSKPMTRKFHFVGTTGTVLCWLQAARDPRHAGRWLLASALSGYGAAWISHFFIEKNRPATFTYPRWSLLADFKMWGMTWLGTIDAEVERLVPKDKSSNGAAHTPPEETPVETVSPTAN